MSQIDLTQYTYNQGEFVDIKIDGAVIDSMIALLNHVYNKETHLGISESYALNTKEVYFKDENGKKTKELETITQDLIKFPTLQSFLNQGSNMQNFTTFVGATALSLLDVWKGIHLKNIESGVAIQKGVFTEQPVEDGKGLS
jgi:ribosomal protein L21E